MLRKILSITLALVWLPSCAPSEETAQTPVTPEGWSALFDGKTLRGWEVTNFGGQGEVHVEDGRIILEWGNDLTGITWLEDFPVQDYEIRLEAMRLKGDDFFCGLTVPVKDSHCSLIVGGWGGVVVGISSIDGLDASENETTQYMKFENQRWYEIRMRVSTDHISAWIDGELVVKVPVSGHQFTVRPEVGLSRPFGIATWRTTAAIRNIFLREKAFSVMR